MKDRRINLKYHNSQWYCNASTEMSVYTLLLKDVKTVDITVQSLDSDKSDRQIFKLIVT